MTKTILLYFCIHICFLKKSVFSSYLVKHSTFCCSVRANRAKMKKKKSQTLNSFAMDLYQPYAVEHIFWFCFVFLFSFFAVLITMIKRGEKLIPENYKIFLCKCTEISIAHSMLFCSTRNLCPCKCCEKMLIFVPFCCDGLAGFTKNAF